MFFKKMLICLLLLVILIFTVLLAKKYNDNLNTMNLEKVYTLEKTARKDLYKRIKLQNLFKKYPKNVNGLKFGYICPGAMKTVQFLNKNMNNSTKKTINSIKKLSDFQFFVEIYVVYKDYLDDDVRKEMLSLLKNNSCKISKTITVEITALFGELPKKIRQNLPDDFYHIRHNTLVCSNNKELARERIELLKSIYGSQDEEAFDNIYSACLGKRDGVSGCRDCCNGKFTNNRRACIKACMDF